ncbi:MAG TPA: thioredoxin domain-containing protein [Phycisphaerae bacterium]|nr:thioredoxin domain-containing protein [Phycisphaerae bacterium]HNU46570.1 thioredoxin domain-containing protein [Phycisphaerae bacterium]
MTLPARTPATAATLTTNRLIHATSPYLLQHAHNPVDWYEWGPEALEKARREDKPIFLSIGYAACHWCHVMGHETFESGEAAGVLNAHFVSIKVDREERPDLDEIYMAYTQASTGRGGWPMNVWLTPDGTPFYAGTYFPRPQFVALCTQIAELWQTQRNTITDGRADVHAFFARWADPTGIATGATDTPAGAGGDARPLPHPDLCRDGSDPRPPRGHGDLVSRQLVDQGARVLAAHVDRTHGGFSSNGNKFPPSLAVDLMLRVHRRTGNPDLAAAVDVTLTHMARGGIFDHVAGGICRYSTDPQWLVPHFEKMLYDQALVSSAYLDAYQVTGNPLYARTAREILNYVLADLQAPDGGFYSSRDADSEGMEGAYYIWTKDEVTRILGEEDAPLCCAYFDITDAGNWSDALSHAPPGPRNILHVSKPPEAFARMHGLSVEELELRIETWRAKLREARTQRVPPGLDDKVLTAWNGLMIASLAKGARTLDEPKFAHAAARAADFILEHLRRDGRLLRTYRNGTARLPGYLDDYAFFIEGLLNLYEADFDRRWLAEAVALNEVLTKHYRNPADGTFFFTADDAEPLLVRSKSPQDGALPSGNSVHALNLLRLAALLGRDEYRQRAAAILRAFAPLAERSPAAFERLLCAADFYHDRVPEVVIAGDPGRADTQALLRVIRRPYLPNKVVLHTLGTDRQPVGDERLQLPQLLGKGPVHGRAAAFVCVDRVCRPPVTTPQELAKLLDAR